MEVCCKQARVAIDFQTVVVQHSQLVYSLESDLTCDPN
jgi:hypothetical protein